MLKARAYNVYCDESCHLPNDHIPVVALGAVTCPADRVRAVTGKMARLKSEYGLSHGFEPKWTKVSPSKVKFYLSLVDLFAEEEEMSFRGLVALKPPFDDKSAYSDWRASQQLKVLHPILLAAGRYRIFTDMLDTRGGHRIRDLRRRLSDCAGSNEAGSISLVQQVRSHECGVLQIADLLVGALAHANRSQVGSPAKKAVVSRLQARFGCNALTSTSAIAPCKFNILAEAKKEASNEVDPPAAEVGEVRW